VDRLQWALTLQLGLYALAIVAAIVAIVRFLKLQQLVSAYANPSDGWHSEQARAALRHALKPLWLTIAVLVLGAFVPRLLDAASG
jgi:uncharacterized membrane protein YgcG